MASKEKEIREQLDRILLSQDFQTSKGLADFLRFVVEEALAGRADEINQRTVGIRALGYPDYFDPQSNPAVRMQASRLRRALDKYYSTQVAEDLLRIEIPKGGYVPAFLPNNGAPLDLEPTDEAPPHIHSTTEPKFPAHDGPSVAVLPFKYLGKDSENAFIAAGITEEIVIALTLFPEFLVVGLYNRELLRQMHLDARGIGREYNVRFLLDGAVRLRGQSLRISAKLTDTFSGRELWGQVHSYDIEKNSVDQVEDDIVSRVVAEIGDNFGVIPRTMAQEILSHHGDSLSDYAAVLRFHHHVRTVSENSLTEAIAALEEIVQRDPNHDLALALLGDLLTAPYWLGYTDSQYDLGRAAELGKRALALNPNSQPAYLTMAIVHYLRFQKAACLSEIDRVLELNPNNANYLANSALFLMGLEQWERGLLVIQKAMRLNPHHPGWYHLIPFLYHYYRGEYDAALGYANRFNTPDYFWDPLIRAAVLGQLGRQIEAKKALGELIILMPDFGSRGRSLIQRMLFQEEHVEMILEGLVKAGLEM